MIKALNTQTYDNLKSAFIDGIEFKRVPLETYLAKHSVSVSGKNNEIFGKIAKDLFQSQNIIQKLKNRAESMDVDFEFVRKKVISANMSLELFEQGRHMLENTFNRGVKNPAVCFMAWYDALAEYVISVANTLIGQKAPIPVIKDELQQLSKSLSKNRGFVEAKGNVYNSLKKMYPKTYKKRLKIIEQGFDKQIQQAVTDIVKRIVKG